MATGVIEAAASPCGVPPAVLRLSRLTPLAAADIQALTAAAAGVRPVPLRRELVREGTPVTEARLILDGLAALTCSFPDGRRQYLSFLLPGDLVGVCDHAQPLATSTVMTLTPMRTCVLPPSPSRTLASAYAISRALHEAYLLRQIRRLGRLGAQARIGDFLLEVHERLSLAGLVHENGFELPLTQEMLADALGLTSVHVNRMLQLLRQSGDVIWRNGRVTLPAPARLAQRTGRSPVLVTGVRR